MKMSFDLAGPVVHSGSEFTFRGLTMKKFLLAGVAALALGAAGSANAADLGRPVYKAPPPVAVPVPVRVFSWTGCYVGGNIGGAWGRKEFSSAAHDVLVLDDVFPTAETPTITSNLFKANSLLVSTGAFHDIHTSGFIGGGQIGCNYQFGIGKGLGGPGAWVIGFEGDFDWGNVKGSRAGSVTASRNALVPEGPDSVADEGPRPGTVTTTATGSLSVKTDFLATATVRLGYAWDRVLFYAKGGAAVAHDKYHLTSSSTHTITAVDDDCDNDCFFSTSRGFTFDAKENRLGWTVGAGVEWAFYENWSAKIEYDFLDFGDKDITFALGPDVATWTVDQRIHEVKFGINYRFGWGLGKGKGKAPIVARY